MEKEKFCFIRNQLECHEGMLLCAVYEIEESLINYSLFQRPGSTTKVSVYRQTSRSSSERSPAAAFADSASVV